MDTARTFTPAQLKLIEKHRDWNVDGEWWGYTFDDFTEVAAAFGIEVATNRSQPRNGTSRSVPEIQFSGFSSQGDGASFLFDRVAVQDIIKAGIKVGEEKPYGEGPHEGYVAEFYALWQLLFDKFAQFSLTSPEGSRVALNTYLTSRRTTHHYSHSKTVQVEVECEADEDDIAPFPDLQRLLYSECGSSGCSGFGKDVDRQVERIADALYATLESEYEFQTSDEQVWASLEANGITPEEDDDTSD